MTIISNDEIHDLIKIIKSLEDSGLLIKGVTQTVQNEAREDFLVEFLFNNKYIRCKFIGRSFYK